MRQNLAVISFGERVHASRDADRRIGEQTAVGALPEYLSDDAIRSEVQRALYQDEAIRRIDGKMIALDVSDGHVTLTGHLSDGRNLASAEQLATEVRGVRHVTNKLITDAQLTYAVAEALAQIDYTSRASAGFTVHHGAVILFGYVPNARVHEDIETVVAGVPQTRMVINELRSPDMPKPAASQRMLQPRYGQNVFAHDGYLGRIKHVVMDARLRTVTAIVVDSPVHRAANDWLDDAPPPNRMLVVAADAIETLSPLEVFLKIDSDTAAMAAEFRPRSYIAPPAGWRAPFPYRREEVVFEAPNTEAARHQPITVDRAPGPQVYVDRSGRESRETRKVPVSVYDYR